MKARAPLRLSERIRDRGYSQRLLFWATLFATSVFVAIALLVGLTALNWHESAQERARTDAASLTRAVTDSVARTVQLVDATLELTARRLIEHFDEEDEFETYLREELAFAPHLRQIVVAKPDGTVEYDTARTGADRLDVADILARHQAGGGDLHIGAVHQGRYLGITDNSGQRLIPMARVVRSGHGTVLAVVIAAINQHYFIDAFQQLGTGSEGWIGLARHDGTLLAATGEGQDWAPGAMAGAPLFATHLRQAEFGQFTSTLPDGVERLSAYRMTHRWPLVVAIGLSRAEIDARWRAEVMAMALPAGLVCAILLAIAAVLVRVLLIRAREEEALAIAGRALMNVGDAIIITDPAAGNAILYVNPAFERMSGYALAEVIGLNPRFLHRDERDQPGLAEIRRAIDEERGCSVVLRNYRKDGTPYWTSQSVTPVRDEGGRLIHFVGVQSDITARIEAEAQRERLIGELTDAGAKLQRFTYVASHELMQPIVSIQGFAALLQRDVSRLDETGREAVAEVMAGAARARAMVTGLREYFQLSAASAPLEPVDMGALVRSVTGQLSESAQAVGAEIAVGPLPVVQADAQQMRLLWRNLIENAIKFRRPDSAPRIAISAERLGDFQRFTIHDDGIGVAPDRLSSIFDVLSRLNGADYPGLGMGLPACKTIVERHGGRIWVESDPGRGSTFLFTIPDPKGTRT